MDFLEMLAVTFKTSFWYEGGMFPSLPLSPSTLWPPWSGLKRKWNLHHFLLSSLPIKRLMRQHSAWSEFSHIHLRGDHFYGHISGCWVQDVLVCHWMKLAGWSGSCWLDQQRLNSEETWRLWLDCYWCSSESLTVSWLTYHTKKSD